MAGVMLSLYREQSLVLRLPLGERPLELGRAPGCDFTLDDPELAERQWLLVRQRGTVVLYDVSAQARSRRAQHVPFGQRLALGGRYSLERDPSGESESGEKHGLSRDTESLHIARTPARWLGVVVGRGSDARVLRVGDGPLHIGRAAISELVLSDRAVSERHCRLEPCGQGLLVRDLGSRNGTVVNGVRIETAFVQRGAHIRVGRSDLYVVERESSEAFDPRALIAHSAVMLSALAEVERAAPLDWPALVLGESGTGKEAIARMLHERSPRRGHAYVTLNAGGVPAELVESELFGHERGAFTGAHGTRRGVFEQADGGTLFLDEIGELPLSMQARLLRVLECGEVRRVGAEGARSVNVRLVCATHRDLRALAANGGFRADLYFRIARSVIELPPLRARREDIGPISEHVLAGLAPKLGPKSLCREALERLSGYSWPGNVRELRNVVSAAAAAAGGPTIERDDIERSLARLSARPTDVLCERAVQEAIEQHGGNVSAAARALGVARSTLRDRARKG
jgi:transcriptional regulator with AAA-type ATPase domain